MALNPAVPSHNAVLHYTPNLNPRLAVAVARHLNAPVTFVRSHPRDPRHTEAFRAINPNALCPVLVEGDRSLWETDAIACRLSAMVGSDFWCSGELLPEMIKWLSWSAYHLGRPSGDLYFFRLVLPTFSDERPDPQKMADAEAEFREHAAVLEGELAHRTWLVGNRLTYADFRVASALPFADRAGMPLAEFPHIRRWHAQLWELPAWREPFAGLAL